MMAWGRMVKVESCENGSIGKYFRGDLTGHNDEFVVRCEESRRNHG